MKNGFDAAGDRRWTYLAAAIVTEISATISLRAATDGHHALYAVVVVGYVSSFILLALIMRTGLSLGAAYGIWAACGVAGTAVLGTVLFDEPLTALMGAGIALVVVGVLLVHSGSHPSPTPERDDL